MERADRVWRKRRNDGGVLMGLCAGIGAHLGVDPVLVRLSLVLMVLLPVSGLAVVLIYFLFSLFIPFEPQGSS